MALRLPHRLGHGLLLAALAFSGVPALACSIVVDIHKTSLLLRVIDWKAPAPAATPSVFIRRGVGPRVGEDGVASSTSCDDIGYVRLTFSEPRAPESEVVGYAFEVLAGQAPDGFIPEQPLRTIDRGDGRRGLTLTWIDGATEAQEALAFVLGIRTVDRAGNRSRTVTRVLIRDSGREAR